MVELLVYVTLSTFVLLSLGSFVSLIIKTKNHHKVVKEVNVQGERIARKISDKVRTSFEIVDPEAGQSDNWLIVKPEEESDNIMIYQSNEKICLENLNDEEVCWSNSRVRATELNFQNLSRPETKGSVKFTFKLSSKKGRTDYSQDFTSATTIR